VPKNAAEKSSVNKSKDCRKECRCKPIGESFDKLTNNRVGLARCKEHANSKTTAKQLTAGKTKLHNLSSTKMYNQGAFG
jgi:hypothetical protein